MTIQKVLVVGSGTMGNGIAQVCASAGLSVTMTDVSEDVVLRGRVAIEKSLGRLVEKGKLTSDARAAVLAAIVTSTDPEGAAKSADLVIEAVPERMDLKLALFRMLGKNAPAHAILATNTSSLSVTEIASAVDDPGRVVGLHFFNPVPVMELLEIVRGLRARDEVIEASRAFAAKIGKQPIVVKDIAGFATSRLGVILGCEAMRMLEQGVASAEDIAKVQAWKFTAD